jgi:hypothetical protein
MVPTIFLPLTVNFDANIVIAEYNKFTKLESGQSCLSPIKQVLSTFDKNLLNCQYTFDLLPVMFELNIIESALSVNYSKSNLEFVKYGQEEIDIAIHKAAQLC